MGLRECRLILVWPRADDEVVAHDSATHMTIHHEREPAKHSLFL